VYPFPEKGEAGASIDFVGSLRVDVVTELKEMGNGVTSQKTPFFVCNYCLLSQYAVTGVQSHSFFI
jgi:hypothetical protein